MESRYIIECRRTLKRQLKQLRGKDGYPNNPVTCPCGRTLALFSAFKCYHCGIWFCKECAKEHFGPDLSVHAGGALAQTATSDTAPRSY